jgi:predicted nucleotidyltransferase component of viral defense system
VNLSLEFLERVAAETGFQIPILEKVARLGELAADIGRHPLLGQALVLKGGTALNLCFGPPRRLSVDLDYNYVGHAERERMIEERPAVEAAVGELARRRQYLVQKSAEAFAGGKYYLGYRSALGNSDRIEVDLNFIFRVPLAESRKREIWQPGELERPTARVVGMEELLAGKLLAFLERGAVRDVWDTANLPEEAGEVLATPRFRPLFLGLAVILEHPLPTYTRERLERLITEKRINEQLRPLLNVKIDTPAGGLIGRAWSVTSGLLDLNDSEREYFDAAQRGELRLDLIFRAPAESKDANRIAAHPAVQWRMANLRARR